MESGKLKEKKYSKRIFPLLARKHQLLVTLVLCNSSVALSLPLVLDQIVPAWAAIVVSVTAILIFGEVIPQAICVRHALAIGAFFTPAVRVLMFIFMPLAWPMAKLLDRILGTSEGDYMRREEMSTFIGLHAHLHKENEEPLINSEVKLLKGALSLMGKHALDIATPIDKVYSLHANCILSKELIQEIITSGVSRVPLYEEDNPDILTSYLLVKTLALVDPRSNVPLKAASSVRTRDLPRAPSNIPLYDLMSLFQERHAHMCALYDPEDASDACIAIVTLEDLFEELIGTEITDETVGVLFGRGGPVSYVCGCLCFFKPALSRSWRIHSAILQCTDSQAVRSSHTPNGKLLMPGYASPHPAFCIGRMYLRM